jgi:hypothetical protein
MSVADSREPVVTGGCQCGAVRYALYAAPEGVHVCHCRMCQRAVGGPFAALAPVRKADFAWTNTQPNTFQSSSVAAREYCAACGTPLSFRYLDSEWIDLTVGSFDDPNAFPPHHQYGTESTVDWFPTLHTLPVSRTEDSMEQDRQARLESFQKSEG